MKIMLTKLIPAAVISLALPFLSANAGEKPFPHIVDALEESWPEGFAIGKGHTAYNGSVDGSIYKIDLRSGAGEILVPVQDPYACTKLGMRVDPRTNYLFVAGCESGNLWVFDADTGVEIGNFPLPLPDPLPLPQVLSDPDDPGSELIDDTYQIVNDLTITKDAVYITDSHQPLLYRLPLSRNGELPGEDAATAIVLGGDFVNIAQEEGCCGANGIVSTPDGKTLVVGQSNYSVLYRVDPSTGYADEILVDPLLSGFLDGLAMHNRTLYIMNPAWETVQVVELDKEMLTGEFVGTITDPNMSGVASGALFGKSLYVNNAHYDACCDDGGNLIYTERSITKLNRHALEPVE